MTAAVPALAALLALAAGSAQVRLPVPIVEQAPERCGPAALGMVLRYYGAPDSALARAAAAYDPVLRGALITDLARAAEASGYEARVATASTDALEAALGTGTPPIVLYDAGFGPLGRKHFAVVVGWDPERKRFVLHDGRAKPREMKASEFVSRWTRAGSLALLVRDRP